MGLSIKNPQYKRTTEMSVAYVLQLFCAAQTDSPYAGMIRIRFKGFGLLRLSQRRPRICMDLLYHIPAGMSIV